MDSDGVLGNTGEGNAERKEQIMHPHEMINFSLCCK